MSVIYYNFIDQKKAGVRAMVSKMKVARVQKGLTQHELAEHIGVTRQTIGLIEQGRFNPSLALCILICKALGKSLNDLFWEEDAL
jgi:putative transcriptional regulator